MWERGPLCSFARVSLVLRRCFLRRLLPPIELPWCASQMSAGHTCKGLPPDSQYCSIELHVCPDASTLYNGVFIFNSGSFLVTGLFRFCSGSLCLPRQLSVSAVNEAICVTVHSVPCELLYFCEVTVSPPSSSLVLVIWLSFFSCQSS